jgi:glycosyltransferase involved in cell wall biosynthesis
MGKIKILYLIDTITGPQGGTEKHILEVFEHIDKKKFEIHLGFLQTSPWLKENVLDSHYTILNFRGYWHPNFLRQLVRLVSYIRREQFQIVQCFFLEGNVVGVLAAKIAGIPHILAARRNLGYWNSSLRIFLLRWLKYFTTGYVANCQAVKDYVRITEKVLPDKIKVLYNGVDLNYYDISQGRGGDRIFPPDKIVVGLVANLKKIKGIQYFLEAGRLASVKRRDLLFVIIGGGYEEVRFKKMACQLGLEKTVCFLGIKEDIRPYLHSFHMAVNSSLTEGFSNSILEYLAAGLPVIATKVGGNSELVEDGVNGFLVPPADGRALADKILVLAENQEMRKRFGQQAREIAEEKFSLARQMARLEDFYSELVQG